MNRLLPIRIGLCFLFFAACQSENKVILPFYNDPFFTPHWFTQTKEIPQNFHRISSFSLINQEGNVIHNSDFDNKIYVADFFFTRCPGICPKMTEHMRVIQNHFLNDPEVLLISHSVTPEKDSVKILKEYAEQKGVISGKWYLVTGKRAEIYSLGREDYFVEEDLGLSKKEEDFIHTENFVLIDHNRYIRGIYNGLNKSSINQLIADIKTLKRQK